MGQVPIHYNNQFYFAYTFFIIWPLLFSFTFLSKIRLHLFFNIGDVEFNSVQKCQSCNTSGSCEFQTDCQSVKKLVPCKVNTFYIDICCKTTLSRVVTLVMSIRSFVVSVGPRFRHTNNHAPDSIPRNSGNNLWSINKGDKYVYSRYSCSTFS